MIERRDDPKPPPPPPPPPRDLGWGDRPNWADLIPALLVVVAGLALVFAVKSWA